MGSHLIFVYGTLKKNEPNHHLMEKKDNGEAKFVCNAISLKKHPLVIASEYNIPFLLYTETEKGHQIHGEIYEVDDAMLQKMDELERHPTFYERMMGEFIRDSSLSSQENILNCWCYFLKNYKSYMTDLPYVSFYSNEGPGRLEYCPLDRRVDPKILYESVKD